METGDELVAAAATPLVYEALAEGPRHGFAIAKRVRELSDGELPWSDGMLYPLLHRLGRLGNVTSEWRANDGRPRRYYALAGGTTVPGHQGRRRRGVRR